MLGAKPQHMTALSIDYVIKIKQHPWWWQVTLTACLFKYILTKNIISG